MKVRTVLATRYVTPLREGGSLPAIIEADDDGMYVLKFRGAGQGPKALVAELIAGELARAAGLPVPEIVFVQLDPELARTEPDPEIQDLIKASDGLNLALDYLPGSVGFDPLADRLEPELASSIVWFDASVSNVDRTARNTNILMWHKRPWLIDHGAALYFHHGSDDFLARTGDPFPLIKDHVLLRRAAALPEADTKMSSALNPDVIDSVVVLLPDPWLSQESSEESSRNSTASGATVSNEFLTDLGERPTATDRNDLPGSACKKARRTYRDYLVNRLASPRAFVEEAIRARSLYV